MDSGSRRFETEQSPRAAAGRVNFARDLTKLYPLSSALTPTIEMGFTGGVKVRLFVIGSSHFPPLGGGGWRLAVLLLYQASTTLH